MSSRLGLGTAASLLDPTGIPTQLSGGGDDPGLLLFDDGETEAGLSAFIEALARHRVFQRETDPPLV